MPVLNSLQIIREIRHHRYYATLLLSIYGEAFAKEKFYLTALWMVLRRRKFFSLQKSLAF